MFLCCQSFLNKMPHDSEQRVGQMWHFLMPGAGYHYQSGAGCTGTPFFEAISSMSMHYWVISGFKSNYPTFHLPMW
jgi:hypothetical protein